MARSGRWSDDGDGKGLEHLRRRPPPPAPAPSAADRFELRASEVARAILDALPEEGPHGCALILRRSVAILESRHVPRPLEGAAGAGAGAGPPAGVARLTRRDRPRRPELPSAAAAEPL